MRPRRIMPPLAALLWISACSLEPEPLPANEADPAPANAAGAAGASNPQTQGPLAVYVGKAPFEPVEGVAFLDHPRVRATVEVATVNSDARAWVFRSDATRGPIVMKDGRLLSGGCETGNCAGRNWAILIDPLGAVAEVCYFVQGTAGGRSLWLGAGRDPAERDGNCRSEQE